MTLIIAAYNEEKDIGNKLENSLRLDYPEDKLEIIVASDHSDDDTDHIVQSYANKRVRLLRAAGRIGKTGVQNLALGRASGEIIVFSDATTIYAHDALRKIVRHFHDGTVGGVEGRLIYLPAGNGFISNKDLLKCYEAKIKTLESIVWGGVGDNGALYALRRELCRALREDLTSDFAGPVYIARQHKRFVFDPQAICHERVSLTSADEFKRKVRTVRAGLNVFAESLDLLNFVKYPWVSYVLVSRKFARWLSSVLLGALALSNLVLLETPFYKFAFVAQVVFYVLALIGFIIGDSSDRVRLISIPKSFVLVHAAALCGIVSYVFRKSREVWNPKR